MRSRFLAVLAASSFLFASAALLTGRAPARSQETQEQQENEELLANLATGQVEIYVGRDGVAIGILGNAFEPESHPPLVAALGSARIAVLLGAVDWFYPGSQQHVRLDARVARMSATLSAGRPRLSAQPAEDLDVIGTELLEPLRKLAAGLHAPVVLPDRTPLLEIVLVSYDRIEGARVRDLAYSFEQEPLRGDFYQTLVDRPQPFDLYPPAHAGQTAPIELSYPPGSSPAIADLLAKNDPRLAPVEIATAERVRVAKLLEQGKTAKVSSTELAEFLRAALPAVRMPGTIAAVALLNEMGLQWVLPPPETVQPPEKVAGEKPRPPGAPTLHKEPPK
jgi:hypothetical protein